MNKEQYQAIVDNLNERMSNYTDSRQPTNDEVRIAFLIQYVEELKEALSRKNIDMDHLTGSSVTHVDWQPNSFQEYKPE